MYQMLGQRSVDSKMVKPLSVTGASRLQRLTCLANPTSGSRWRLLIQTVLLAQGWAILPLPTYLTPPWNSGMIALSQFPAITRLGLCYGYWHYAPLHGLSGNWKL